MSRAWRPRSGFSAHKTQGVDDGAFGDRAALALRRHVVENPGELLEVGDLAPDVGEMLQGHRPDLGTGPGVAVDQGQQAAHLVEREAELTRAPDERQSLQVLRRIVAVAARSP